MPSQRFSNALAAVAVTCALTVTALLVMRELRTSRARDGGPLKLSAERWEELSSGGEVQGDSTAKLRIVVFADFQCPACKDFAQGSLQAIRASYPDDVEVRFRNWPLPYHKLAEALAVQAICAGRQKRFWAYHDILFLHQDSIAGYSPDSLAKLANIPSAKDWSGCLEDSTVRSQIAKDVALAKAINAKGTPTVIVNGYQYDGFPGEDELERYMAAGRPSR